MNEIIANPYVLPVPCIVVQTRLKRAIANQQKSITSWDRAQFADLERQYPGARERCQATGLFNCHGLTFASRRTCIADAQDVRTILSDDNYVEIRQADTLPGDVVIYEGERGDVEHSGIVVEPGDATFGIPRVVSKWGAYKELIHSANNCPYNYAGARYYRIRE